MNANLKEQRELPVIQKWMQAVITHPSGIQAGLESPFAQSLIETSNEDIEQVIHRSNARTSIQRLQVYGNAYYARLFECLEASFPAVTKLLGKEIFQSFCFEYLQKYPSQSYTLNHLADNFPQFLSESSPSQAESTQPTWEGFLVELATFEWEIGQVFDGPGHEELSILKPEDFQQISPETWADSRLEVSPALRLLQFQFPINEFYTHFRNAEELLPPEPLPTFVALIRKNFVVRRVPLSRDQYHLLLNLIQGESIGQAIELTANVVEDFNEFSEHLGSYFSQFAVEQFFIQID